MRQLINPTCAARTSGERYVRLAVRPKQSPILGLALGSFIGASGALAQSGSVEIPDPGRGEVIFLEPRNGESDKIYEDKDIQADVCREDESVLYFVNGINNSWESAAESAARLMFEVSEDIPTDTALQGTSGIWRGAVAYNQSRTKHPGSDWTFAYDYLAKVKPDLERITTGLFHVDLKEIITQLPEYKEAIAVRESEWIAQIEDSEVNPLQDSIPLAKTFDYLGRTGRAQIVVGHSHGTVLSNIAYNTHRQDFRPGFGVVLAAALQPRVNGASRFWPGTPGPTYPYVTIEEDEAVYLFSNPPLIPRTPPTLPANVDLYPSLEYFPTERFAENGHAFIKHYLSIPGERWSTSQQVYVGDELVRRPVSGLSTGEARERILSSVRRYRAELVGMPCHGFTISADGYTRDYIGFDQDGEWRFYDGDGDQPILNLPVTRQGGFIDWRGDVDSGGEPSEVLSWVGSSYRYSRINTDSSRGIWRHGRVRYVAPGIVVGAAMQHDASTGRDWVIAVVLDQDQVENSDATTDKWVVYRIAANDFRLSPEVAGSVSAGSGTSGSTSIAIGWQKIGEIAQPTKEPFRRSPVFFNPQGTEFVFTRLEERTLPFSEGSYSPLCAGAGGVVPEEYCEVGELGYYAPYPAGQYAVETVSLVSGSVSPSGEPLADGSSGVRITSTQSEIGDTSILAADYDPVSGEQLVLREVNTTPAWTDPTRIDPAAPSAERWLEVNGEPLFTADVLDCSTSDGRVCRHGVAHPISDVGGPILTQQRLSRDTPYRTRWHVLGLDLRTRSALYSKLEGDFPNQESSYHILHDGTATEVGRDVEGTTESVGGFQTSRYGFFRSGANQPERTTYIDANGELQPGPIKRNNVLGQYEYWPLTFGQPSVAKAPDKIGMATSVSGDLLVSFDLPTGETVNFHSGSPDLRLDTLIGRDLSGKAVHPVSTR